MFSVRLAVMLFCDAVEMKKQMENYDSTGILLNVTRALDNLLRLKIKPFFEDIKFRWGAFREEDLWCREVELVFTLNEAPLREIYHKYARMNCGKDEKPLNADYMTLNECMILMREHCPLKLSKYLIREAFALCKMTVINEHSQAGTQQYQELKYVEFLEFIARVADLFFTGSEMEGIELHEKIEHILDEILPIIEKKRKRQRVYIDEFSESDDDY